MEKKHTEVNSHDSSLNALNLIETDLEVKAFIYQQINDLTPYLTADSTVMVIARDPDEAYKDDTHVIFDDESKNEPFKFRIAIILKESESSLEAEGFGDDIYDAIRYAKEALSVRLSEIQDEVESPQERLKAIQQATSNSQIH